MTPEEQYVMKSWKRGQTTQEEVESTHRNLINMMYQWKKAKKETKLLLTNKIFFFKKNHKKQKDGAYVCENNL